MAMVRRSKDEWVKVIAEFESSGLTAAIYARRLGVAENTLLWWRSRLRRESSGEREVGFVDVVVEPKPVKPLLVLVGGTSHRIVVPHGFEATELRRLVDALC